MFYSYFGAAFAKIFNTYKKIPPKKFLENLNLFSQPELPEKREEKLNDIYPSRDIRVMIVPILENLSFSGDSDWENKLKFPKTF